MKKNKKKLPKTRNWHAVNAWNRRAGPHTDRKKEKSRKICRKKVKLPID
jgi:hypothetical protein